MSIRRTMKARGAMTAVAATTGLVLTLTGCSGGDDDKPESEGSSTPADNQNDGDTGGDSAPDDDQVLAEVTGSDVTLTINSAQRDDGGFVSVTGSIKNGGGGLWTGVEWKSDEAELSMKNPNSMAAAKLVDKAGKKRYFILRDTEGRCLCTTFKGGVKPGGSTTWYAQFPAPPKGNNKVDFQIADMPPASITISEG